MHNGGKSSLYCPQPGQKDARTVSNSARYSTGCSISLVTAMTGGRFLMICPPGGPCTPTFGSGGWMGPGKRSAMRCIPISTYHFEGRGHNDCSSSPAPGSGAVEKHRLTGVTWHGEFGKLRRIAAAEF